MSFEDEQANAFGFKRFWRMHTHADEQANARNSKQTFVKIMCSKFMKNKFEETLNHSVFSSVFQ